MSSAPLALRVLGSAENRRAVVGFHKAMTLCAHADPSVQCDLPSYLSAFAFPNVMRDLINATDSTAGYDGPVGVPFLNFDLDRADLDDAIRDARKLAAYLADRYAADPLACFSGSKGFHVMMPMGRAVEPSPDAHRTAKALAVRLAGEVGVTIDQGVYDRVRLWRAINSRHTKTGLHKVAVELDDLMHMDADAVRRHAVEPIPIDLPASPSAVPVRLATDWLDAVRQVGHDDQARRERATGPGRETRLNPGTRDLILDPGGIAVGERHRAIFSAAANLAGFDSIDDLVAAVLTDPALDTGLPPSEVARQIRSGIAHARRGRGGHPDAEQWKSSGRHDGEGGAS
jgi:hypothetical protein